MLAEPTKSPDQGSQYIQYVKSKAEGGGVILHTLASCRLTTTTKKGKKGCQE